MLNPKELSKATGGKLTNFEPREVEGFSIDSRSLTKGDFFIPLPGSRTDGHQFLFEAFEKGASGAFVRSQKYIAPEFTNLVVVDDTEDALLNAAKNYRSSFDVPLVGVTGSWGKTTTKELIASILSESGKVHKSSGNYNTEYGLPLSLLEMEESTDYGVFELGLQYPGDIEMLSHILSPTIGLITGVGKVHTEHFQSVGEIAKEKLKLAKGMDPGRKILINRDSEPLRDAVSEKKDFVFVEYGVEKSSCNYYGTDLKLRGTDGVSFRLKGDQNRIGLNDGSSLFLESSLNSKANIYNILGASAIALEMGVSPSSVEKGVDINPLSQRLNPIEFSGGIVIDDTYNANPAATINALDLIHDIDSKKNKYFVFGDMKELGENAPSYHRDLASYINKAGISQVLAIGELTRALVNELNTGESQSNFTPSEWFESRSKLKNKLKELIEGKNNLVLVKGSRSMEMEEFVDFLIKGKIK